MIYMFFSNNPSSRDINSSNLPCFPIFCCFYGVFLFVSFYFLKERVFALDFGVLVAFNLLGLLKFNCLSFILFRRFLPKFVHVQFCHAFWQFGSDRFLSAYGTCIWCFFLRIFFCNGLQ